MPTKRQFRLTVMIFTGGLLVLGAAHVWSAKTLAETDKGGVAHTVAEAVTLV